MIDEPKIIKRDLNRLSFNENKNLFGSLINEIYELFFNTLPFLISFLICLILHQLYLSVTLISILYRFGFCHRGQVLISM